MNALEFDDISQRHIGRAIALQAQQNGAETFIRSDEVSYSFAEVNQRVNDLAAGLAAMGLGVGDRLAFYMDSSPEVIFLVLATNKLGAVWVPVNTDYKGSWLEDTINRSRPEVLVVDAAHAQRVADVRAQLSVSQLVVAGESAALQDCQLLHDVYVPNSPEPDMSAFRYGDDCAVLWTSGTTGKSKGVLQSHNVWFNAVEGANGQFGMADDDVIYSVLPMYNSAAWVVSIFRALIAGVPLAIDPAFSVSQFWQRVDYYGATQCFTLGAMHMYLWDAPAAEDDASHSLRKLMAVPMPPNVAGPFSERFGLDLVSQGLGQSEALRTIVQDPPVVAPPGSIGLPAYNIDVRLVGDDGEDVEQGEAGELWVKPRAEHVIFSGYFDNPEATAGAYEGPWYKTGDLLRQDEAGYYYFSDRKKDAVRHKGRNIATFEVELAARRHPAIADCAAFGVPSEELESEDELKLDVLLKAGAELEAEELATFINDNAPYFFVPRYIEFVDSLPYTPTNKIQKFKLREKGVTPGAWDAKTAGFKAQR